MRASSISNLCYRTADHPTSGGVTEPVKPEMDGGNVTLKHGDWCRPLFNLLRHCGGEAASKIRLFSDTSATSGHDNPMGGNLP